MKTFLILLTLGLLIDYIKKATGIMTHLRKKDQFTLEEFEN